MASRWRASPWRPSRAGTSSSLPSRRPGPRRRPTGGRRLRCGCTWAPPPGSARRTRCSPRGTGGWNAGPTSSSGSWRRTAASRPSRCSKASRSCRCRLLEYRGREFEEMNVDALIERKPQVALIDELAHTNIPGAKRAKRWEDVIDALAAGIEVITTINIQHLESLNDVIANVTGIRQQETVPDWLFDLADQVELVDMSPHALRRRIAHGNVYPDARKAELALQRFFTTENLTALRELALLKVANQVDDSLLDRWTSQGAATDVRERVLVCVSQPGDLSDTLIRRASRIAQRARGELLVLHVRGGEGATDPEWLQKVEIARARSRWDLRRDRLRDAASTRCSATPTGTRSRRSSSASHVRSRWKELTQGSFVTRLIRAASNLDIHVISRRESDRTPDGESSTAALAPRPASDPDDRRLAQPLVELSPAAHQLRGQRETALGGKLERVLRSADADREWGADPRTTSTASPPGRHVAQGVDRARARACSEDHQRPRVRHRLHAACASARLSSRTFTRSSPRNPRVGPSVCSSISDRTCSSDRPRTSAIRGAWSSAAATEMCGSRPLAEAVSRSAGMSAIGQTRVVGAFELEDRVGALGDQIREVLRVRAEVRTRGRRRVVVDRGGAAVEPLLALPQLSDRGAPDELAVHADEGSVGLARHRELRDPGDDERVREAREQGQDHDRAQGSHGGGDHGKFTTSRSMSMSLMPMNGTMIPPNP